MLLVSGFGGVVEFVGGVVGRVVARVAKRRAGRYIVVVSFLIGSWWVFRLC